MKLVKWLTGLPLKRKVISLVVAGTIVVGSSMGIAINANSNANEHSDIIPQIQAQIDTNKSELESKINVLTEQYKEKDIELLAKISANEQALLTLQNEYELKVAELELVNEINAEAIIQLKIEYLATQSSVFAKIVHKKIAITVVRW